MSETDRIRWEQAESGAITGHVGTLPHRAFTIWPPLTRDDQWLLACALSDMAAGRCFGSGPGELKATAERWLTEFIASLGASFPGEYCGECGFTVPRHDHDRNCSHYHEPAKEKGQ